MIEENKLKMVLKLLCGIQRHLDPGWGFGRWFCIVLHFLAFVGPLSDVQNGWC